MPIEPDCPGSLSSGPTHHAWAVRGAPGGGGLGVLGGMGPLAGAAFVYRLAQLTPALTDQQHIPVLLRNDPRIPDRSAARLRTGVDPLPAMRDGMQFLERSGVACIAIPCNTAHLWFDALRNSVSVPVLHIAQAVIQDLRRQSVFSGKVGIMATPATLESKLYQTHLIAAGYQPVVPDSQDVARHCMVAIEAVKTNRLDDAFAPAAAGIHALRQRGVAAVVLGCTELPLAVVHHRRGEFKVVMSDSIDALALAAIDHFGRRIDESPDQGNSGNPATS
jgi:aspartate racemase